jgi:GDP-L-fucose synthase
MDITSKRIVITGGGGFLGSHVVDRLQSMGCRDIFIVRSEAFDLTRAEAVERLFEQKQPEVLIHLAAVVGGIGANRANPGRFFYENAIMGIQLIEAARRFNTQKIVVLGTVCAYPKFCPIPFREADLWNGYPEETNAPYGIAKKALLVQCQSYRQQYGLNAIFLLPVNLYGPRDNFDPETSHVIPALIHKCVRAMDQNRKEIVLWGDGSPTREFLYVEDAAEGIISAAEKYHKPEPVNLGSGMEISIRELAEKVANLVGYRGRIVWDTNQPNGQPRPCLDISLAEKEFGFRANTSFDEGLQKTIAWYLARRDTRHQDDAYAEIC